MVLHFIANKQIILGRLRNVGTPPLNLFIQKGNRRKKMKCVLLMIWLVTTGPNRLKCAQHKEHTRSCRPLKPHVLKCPESVRDIGLWPKRRNEKHFNEILLPASHHFLWVKLEEQVRAQAKHRHKPSMMTHRGSVSDGVSCRHPHAYKVCPFVVKKPYVRVLRSSHLPYSEPLAWK